MYQAESFKKRTKKYSGLEEGIILLKDSSVVINSWVTESKL